MEKVIKQLEIALNDANNLCRHAGDFLGASVLQSLAEKTRQQIIESIALAKAVAALPKPEPAPTPAPEKTK
jgi:hypothetical protein